MDLYRRIQRTIIRVSLTLFSVAIISLAILVLVRAVVHSPRAEAASIIYYPNFCLGGWKYPQHGSGPAAVTGSLDPSAFTVNNSTYLESSVAAQLFCGYFSVRNAKNPPTKAVITFNWLLAFETPDLNPQSLDSHTNIDNQVSPISPQTGFILSATSTEPTFHATSSLDVSASVPATQTPVDNSASVINAVPAESTSTPSVIPTSSIDSPSVPASDYPSTFESILMTPPVPVIETLPPAPAPDVEPEPSTPSAPTPSPPAPAPVPETSSDAPQSLNASTIFNKIVARLFAQEVHAAELSTSTNADVTFKDFLEVSYSFDGIRWMAIGRVNRDNWKNFSVEIPVSSWDEVKRLQIMISVLPTLDQKPDIYLDNMSMRAEYRQTMAELASQGFAKVSNAVDSLFGDGNDAENVIDIVPEEKKPPQPIEIVRKKLLFSAAGVAIATPREMYTKIVTTPSKDNSTFGVSGTCGKKYYVILTYKHQSDYLKKQSSFIANEAHECVNGTFSYDLSQLSTDLQTGLQYLLVGEQDETNPWTPVSDLYPIMVQPTTVVEKIYENDAR